ncbi:hypothetical protein [Litorimonas sp. WD9-15]|uniref:hypothetical protein n=1 Tax=Litorimonas sp. WD9-15 TaxID=3418716 RepID=UPI003CFD6674
MIKTTFTISALALTGAANPTAEQVILPLPETQVVAQIAYLEIGHGPAGFEFTLGEDTAVFVDLEFPGDHHIRIGF